MEDIFIKLLDKVNFSLYINVMLVQLLKHKVFTIDRMYLQLFV